MSKSAVLLFDSSNQIRRESREQCMESHMHGRKCDKVSQSGLSSIGKCDKEERLNLMEEKNVYDQKLKADGCA
jgi:hypothetical protein